MDTAFKQSVEQLMLSKGFIKAEIDRFLAGDEFNKPLPEAEAYINSDLVRNMFNSRQEWTETQKKKGVTQEKLTAYLEAQLNRPKQQKPSMPSIISKDESIESQVAAKIISDLIVADKAELWEKELMENWLRHALRRYTK